MSTKTQVEEAIPTLRTKQYEGLARIYGPLIVVEGTRDVSYDETAEIILPNGELRRGRVLEASEKGVVVEVWGGTTGLEMKSTRVRFLGGPLQIPVSTGMLGRIFNGLGEPIDDIAPPPAEALADVNGAPINPVRRAYPQDLIITGISAIDGMNTLIRGQKLPLFSGSGLPHNEIAAQIARQAHLANSDEEFAVVFVAMGVKHDDAEFFWRSFNESGALSNTAMFLNLADDPPMERIIAPRAALALAEFLAFERDMHVLVIMTDMTNYGEALRELASQRGQIPSRKGYPGYLYSDLASIYERTGILKDRKGSITQVPILTMPNDDINHPMPDLTGYITEGQIVLSRDLFRSGIYPCINVLPSLSRLMKDGIGEGFTRADHPALSNQLYAAYAHVQEVRSLAAVIGEEELSDVDKRYLAFGEAFEHRFINQGEYEARSIEQTLDLGWEILSLLPKEELTRVSEKELEQHYIERPSATEEG
ncbi:MAG: V-type ATP synthase subunit B [Anaerolineae bacterium]|nr:V-type ATP synthase subunit B [Anaerolineae bacterium]